MAWAANHDQNGNPTSNFNILYVNRLANGTWLHPALLTSQPSPTKNQNPAVAQINNGTIFLFWSYQAVSSPHYQISYRTLTNGKLSTYKVATTPPINMNDTLPSAAVGRDGTLWLVWTRDNRTAAGTSPVMRQLLYKTLKGGVWSAETNLTSPTDVNQNLQPSIIVGKDGVVRIAFARGPPSTGNFQINYMTYSGTAWSAPTPIVTTCSSSCTGDANPSLTQDRNGTIWLFWARNVVVSTTTDFVIYSKFSVDNGAHWNSSETPLTAVSTSVESQMPTAVQSNTITDKNLWVFYSTNPSGAEFDIWGLKSPNPIRPVHDITVSGFSVSNYFWYAGGLPSIGQGASLPIYVNVTNLGDFGETAVVTLFATNTSNINIGTVSQFITNGTWSYLSFNWNTSGVRAAVYGLSASIAPLPGETLGNLGDNNFSVSNESHILPLGDVDQDGSVTITDVGVVYFNYGFTVGSLHNGFRVPAFADINGNGIIDIVDVGVVSRNYGTFS